MAPDGERDPPKRVIQKFNQDSFLFLIEWSKAVHKYIYESSAIILLTHIFMNKHKIE